MTIGPISGVSDVTAGTMTSAVDPTTSSSNGSTGTTAADSSMASQLATPNVFIKLLMAELEHEDPTNPTTPSAILQQTAELSQVEAITNMTTALTQQRHYTESSDATGLIGKQVSAVVTGRSVTGSVTDVGLSSSGTPTLTVAGVSVPLSAVTGVGSTTGTSPTAA